MKTEKAILVVDDKIENLDLLDKMLRKHQKILTATNGEDALILARKEAPDLILLDIKMPNMDGFEACKILKDNDKTKDIPIIFVSGLDSKLIRQKCFQLGAVNYLNKPLNLANLRSTIENHIQLDKEYIREIYSG